MWDEEETKMKTMKILGVDTDSHADPDPEVGGDRMLRAGIRRLQGAR
jgi:hypothetical protein